MVDLIHNLKIVYDKWEDKTLESMKNITDSTPKISNSESPKNGLMNPLPHNQKTVGAPPAPTRAFKSSHIRWRQLETFKYASGSVSKSSFLGYFKSQPTIAIGSMSGRRPYMGLSCNKCLPVSRTSFIDENVQNLGLNNLLLVPSMNADNGYFVRKFHYLSHVFSCRMKVDYTDVTGDILQTSRVVNAVEKAAKQDVDDNDLPSEVYEIVFKRHVKKASFILKTMKSRISRNLLSFIQWVVFKILSRLLKSVQVHKGQIEIIKQASKSNHPLIFIPLHRSHLDYILVTFILVNNKIKAPLVAAGDNLRIPLIGTLLRGLGAFFIKRKLDSDKRKKDVVYRAILHTYVEKSLRAGHNLEFFIEGGRSRTGKSCIPRTGLLSIVVDAFLDGCIPDAMLIPVAINYDRIMDGNFISEQLGHPKEMESLSLVIRSFWRVINSNFGNVRVDFAQPFSLRELVQAIQARGFDVPPLDNQVDCELRRRRLSDFGGLLCGEIQVDGQEKQLIQCLAEHITYDATRCMSLMTTNLLAFLLLNKFRQGATKQQVVNAMAWLLDHVQQRDRDVGFVGDACDVVDHAANILGPDLVEMQQLPMENPVDDERAQIVLLKPATDLPNVIELSYYSNVVLSLFNLDGVIASAIHALVEEDLFSLRDCEGEVFIFREQLHDKAMLLCEILRNEFIFAPFCSCLSMIITEKIEQFISKEILLAPVELENTDNNMLENKRKQWAKQFASQLEWKSDGDETEDEEANNQQLQINLSEETLEELEFYSEVLSPIIESYWLLACNLPLLVKNQMEEQEFLKRSQLSISNKIASGLVLYAESVSADALRNAEKLLESWKVLECCYVDNMKLVYLSSNYDDEDKLTEIIETFEEFKK